MIKFKLRGGHSVGNKSDAQNFLDVKILREYVKPKLGEEKVYSSNSQSEADKELYSITYLMEGL